MATQAKVRPYQDQPELAARIDADPVFSSLESEVEYERKTQAMRWWYTYVVSDYCDGQASKPVILTIEQGTDFKCMYMTASAFSYSSAQATSFPIPNSAANTRWAGRGLVVKVTDTRAGRDLTSGEVPFELLSTPGYGLSFHSPFPFRYWFTRNSKIRFDVRNLDNANRIKDPSLTYDYSHNFSIALHGYKYLTPGS